VPPPAQTPAGSRDSYSYWLVSTRSMYDSGVLLQHAASSASLARGAALSLSPVDFAKLGVAEGAIVKVANGRGAIEVPVRADAGVPLGIAAVNFNQAGGWANALIDVHAAVNEVRVERS
jgi:anaerobic selenocysteine-containing dehydrogenase